MHLIDLIRQQVLNDPLDYDPVVESENIFLAYDFGDEEAKRALDNVFLCLCGRSLKTLIDFSKGERP